MKKLPGTLFLLFLFALPLAGAKFEELDKPPEGAHKGQIFIGATMTMGVPLGDIFEEEKNFVKEMQYRFDESGIYKKLWVSHLAFNFGLTGEYMPIDHLGVKGKVKYNMVIQRTLFGPDFENWTSSSYREISFLVGPVGHLTNRKQWDLTLTPMAGYAVAWFTPTPIAATLFKDNPDDPDDYPDDWNDHDYSNGGNRRADNFIFGAETTFTAYFSGGFFLSLGFDWTMNFMKFSSPFGLELGGNTYFENGSRAWFHTLSFAVSAGYAFSN